MKIKSTPTRVRFFIKHQGAPVVNDIYIRHKSKNIVALEIDLKSKYCEVDCAFGEGCGIYIGANKRSLNLHPKAKRNDPTAIEFIDFTGWDVFAVGYSRYTIRVCLTRKV